MVLCGVVWCCMVLYGVAWCCMVLHGVMLYCVVLCCFLLCYVVLCCVYCVVLIVLCCVVLCCIGVCCVEFFNVAICCIMLCCVLLYCVLRCVALCWSGVLPFSCNFCYFLEPTLAQSSTQLITSTTKKEQGTHQVSVLIYIEHYYIAIPQTKTLVESVSHPFLEPSGIFLVFKASG